MNQAHHNFKKLIFKTSKSHNEDGRVKNKKLRVYSISKLKKGKGKY